MADVMTREQVEAKLQELDEQYAQIVQLSMTRLASSAEELDKSAQAFYQALGPAGADIDDDTLAATGALQTANQTVVEEARTASRLAGEVGAHMGAALESVGSHRRLSEAVQAHGGAAKMDFYK